MLARTATPCHLPAHPSNQPPPPPQAKENAPAIIFIDEIDAIGTKRFDSQTGADREVQRILLELLNQTEVRGLLREVRGLTVGAVGLIRVKHVETALPALPVVQASTSVEEELKQEVAILSDHQSKRQRSMGCIDTGCRVSPS